ncbi:MAG: hypothetical protein IPF43_05920 [Arcobacter sp.]|nr:hypothetical protein [Arcobacter sp.]
MEENKEDFNTPEENDILDKDKLEFYILHLEQKMFHLCHKVEDNYISYKYVEEELKKEKCNKKEQLVLN